MPFTAAIKAVSLSIPIHQSIPDWILSPVFSQKQKDEEGEKFVYTSQNAHSAILKRKLPSIISLYSNQTFCIIMNIIMNMDMNT